MITTKPVIGFENDNLCQMIIEYVYFFLFVVILKIT